MTSEENVTWNRFRKQKYGLFVHYVPFSSSDKEGKTYDIQTTADRFDAVGFARDVASTGAEYIIFTAWHAGMYPLYPSRVMEEYRPGCCAMRDVIGDMLDAFEPYNVDVWLYTHPYLGYHLSEEARITTGYGVGNHPMDPNKPNPETFRYDQWNNYVNAVYAELLHRYAGRIRGLFLDEGLSSAEMADFVDYARLRRTIKGVDPSILMLQNFYGTRYSCDLGLKEYGPRWGEFLHANEKVWPCYEIPVGTVISENWMAKKPASEPTVRYTPEMLFRYTVLEACCNTDGGGCCWAAGPYVGGGWERDVLPTLQKLGALYEAWGESLAATKPSKAYPVVSGTNMNTLPHGIAATQSEDGKKEYIHVLIPPEGRKLSLPLPADGKVFDNAYLLEDGCPISLICTEEGLELTLPDGKMWDALDTVLVLTMCGQIPLQKEQQYIRDTDVQICYEGDWEYSRWERNCGDYEGDMHQSEQPGAEVTYRFYGTGIAWLSPCSPEQGEADVWIDDVLCATVSTYREAYQAQCIPFVTEELPETFHTIRIVNRNRQICVDGFIVTRSAKNQC